MPSCPEVDYVPLVAGELTRSVMTQKFTKFINLFIKFVKLDGLVLQTRACGKGPSGRYFYLFEIVFDLRTITVRTVMLF